MIRGSSPANLKETAHQPREAPPSDAIRARLSAIGTGRRVDLVMYST